MLDLDLPVNKTRGGWLIIGLPRRAGAVGRCNLQISAAAADLVWLTVGVG